MTNENKNINELVSDDDEPTSELEAITFRQETETRGTLLESDDNTYDLDERVERAERDSKTIGKLQYDIEQLRARWIGVETELRAREEITNRLNAELASTNDELARKDRVLRERDGTIKSLKAEIRDREARHHDIANDLRRQIELASNDIQKLPVPLSGTNSGVDTPNEVAQRARTEEYADTLRRKLQDVLAKYDETSRDRDRLSRTVDLGNETRRKLERELAELTEERDALDARLAVIKDEHAEEIRTLRFELGEAQDTVVQTEALNTQLASDLVDTRSFKEELERMLADSDEKARCRIEELEKELAQLSGVAHELEDKLEERSNAINLLLAELARKSQQLESIDDIGNVISDIDGRIAEQFNEEDDYEPPSTRSTDRVTRVLLGKVGDKLLRFPLFKDKLTIGRTADNDIQLNAPYISRRHAVVTTDGDKTRVIDWGSKNGVYVNSSQVTEHFLKNGDIVTIGNAHFRYDERPKRDS
jgi:DNA repair exonuclease SbcCD ATPase subunit